MDGKDYAGKLLAARDTDQAIAALEPEDEGASRGLELLNVSPASEGGEPNGPTLIQAPAIAPELSSPFEEVPSGRFSEPMIPGPYARPTGAAPINAPSVVLAMRVFYGVMALCALSDAVKLLTRAPRVPVPMQAAAAEAVPVGLFLIAISLAFYGCAFWLGLQRRSGGWWMSVAVLSIGAFVKLPWTLLVCAPLLYLWCKAPVRRWYEVDNW